MLGIKGKCIDHNCFLWIWNREGYSVNWMQKPRENSMPFPYRMSYRELYKYVRGLGKDEESENRITLV